MGGNKLAVIPAIAALALVGCGAEEAAKEPVVDIQTPIGNVSVDSDESGVSVDVQAGSETKEGSDSK